MTTIMMPIEDLKDIGPEQWINRDLSWIAFNERVLAQAEDINLPLLDRAKFLAIVSSNLDEFYMVRVAYMRRALKAGQAVTGPDGMTPRQLLDDAREKAGELLDRANRCWSEDVLPALRASSIDILEPAELTVDDREYLRAYFKEQVLPVLTPMVLDATHPFPLLSSGAIYLLLRLEARSDVKDNFFSKADTVLVQVPSGLGRFVGLPHREGMNRFIMLENIIAEFAGEIVNGYDIRSAHHFRINRDAELFLDDDHAEDLIIAIQEGLKRSRWGAPVRLAVSHKVPESETGYLCQMLGLEAKDVFRSSGMLDMKGLFHLVSQVERPDLQEPP